MRTSRTSLKRNLGVRISNKMAGASPGGVIQAAQVLHADIPKNPGDNVTVQITWSNNTVDGLGNPITWPFVTDFALQLSTGGPFVLQMCDNGANPLLGQTCVAQQRASGQTTTTIVAALPTTGLNNGDRFNVLVGISAEASDANGNAIPGSNFVVDQAIAVDQILIGTPSTGAAVPGASISSITVS